jgi:spore germination cell wall hydrolase CwlJ-like protein
MLLWSFREKEKSVSLDKEVLSALSPEEILALTVIGEARGEPIQGQVAVAASCRNRMHRLPSKYSSYHDVCLEPAQFSCWNEKDANYSFLMELARKMITGQNLTDPYLRQCLLVARGVIGWDIQDNTKGATNYMTNTLFHNGRPKWASGAKGILEIGNHTFFTV